MSKLPGMSEKTKHFWCKYFFVCVIRGVDKHAWRYCHRNVDHLLQAWPQMRHSQASILADRGQLQLWGSFLAALTTSHTYRWSGASCPQMSVDILGTNCDQCRSTVQCCFTSTETVRLIRMESPGRPPRLSHSSWTLPYIQPLRRGLKCPLEW